MEVTLTTLSEILSEAYDSGYSGTDEQRSEIIADILDRHKIYEKDDKPPPEKDKPDVDFREYTIQELRDMPVGAVFQHSTLGKCRVQKRHGDKYMAFDNPGLQPAGFNVDGYPWHLPMKRLAEKS